MITARCFHSIIFNSQSSVGHVNDILKFSSGIMTVVVTLAEKLTKQRSQMETWRLLEQMGMDHGCNFGLLNQTTFNRVLRRFSIKFWLYLILSSAIEVRVMSGIGYNIQWMNFWAYNIYPSTFCRLLHLSHMLQIDFLAENVKVLAQNLIDLKDTMNDGPAHCNEYSTGHDTLLQVGVSRLLDSKKVYGVLWKICTVINELFTWSQVFNITSNFIQLSCDLYWVMIDFIRKAQFIEEVLELAMCLVPAPVIIMMLLQSADHCKFLSSNVGPLLHEIPKHGYPELYEVVFYYSMQIDQQPIKLAVYDLMNIDYTLLIRIAIGIATYMVIFIQLSI
ncbi:gustatory receptor 8a [Topomyia yanbarensis]|uniref:gustatory receptor 8a n=1 Tax=Topomyia yanbarensis TaxID=2498891 RepID=UPI00273BD14B|nr:gustatory receptor 8a [Topomyia yanbarensis]